METIEISDETWDLLKRCAEPYVDRVPEDTLKRILQSFLNTRPEREEENRVIEVVTNAKPRPKGVDDLRNAMQSAGLALTQENLIKFAASAVSVDRRAPRERGARATLDGENIVAVTVRDLYEQALKILVKKHRTKLNSILPFATSSDRFLVAGTPKHPNGKGFMVPVEYDGFFMESHKDYKNAVAHLRQLADRIGISFDYLGR